MSAGPREFVGAPFARFLADQLYIGAWRGEMRQDLESSPVGPHSLCALEFSGVGMLTADP